MLARRLNSPRTSSVGRLFDAVASLAGLRQHTRFEGQAAMELEFALGDSTSDEAYVFDLSPQPATTQADYEVVAKASGNRPFTPGEGIAAEPSLPSSPLVLDWASVVQAILTDIENKVPLPQLSAKFHNALAEGIVAVAQRFGLEGVVLSGGCFQNRYLTERAIQRLREEGFRAYWHQRVPPNDGGISFGQIIAAMRSQGRADTQGASS
jgi:hydrogenase maturation protein HypF